MPVDEITRSLQLLPERLDRLSRELADLRAQLGSLQRDSERKAEAADVGKLREQLGRLTGNVVRKIEVAEAESLAHLNAQLQALNAQLALKCESNDVQRLAQELRGLADSLPALGAKVAGLEARVADLGGSGPAQVQAAEAGLQRRLDQLQEALEAKQSEQQQRVRELTTAMLEKADCSVLDKLNFQYRTLSTTMSQKVDWADMEHVKNQLNTLGRAVCDKAEDHISDQLTVQYEAMCAVAKRVGVGAAAAATSADAAAAAAGAAPQASPKKGLPPLGKPFAACVEHLSQQLQALGHRAEEKADKARVEQLIEQFQVLSDLLAPRLTPKPQPKRSPPAPAGARPQSARAGPRTDASRGGPTRAQP